MKKGNAPAIEFVEKEVGETTYWKTNLYGNFVINSGTSNLKVAIKIHNQIASKNGLKPCVTLEDEPRPRKKLETV